MIGKALRTNVAFAVFCALGYVTAVLVIPPYTPLLEVDSAGYLAFDPVRPSLYPGFLALCKALGLSLIAITWIQLAVFAVALVYFIMALLRARFPRWMLAAIVALLAANVLYSSLHRSIMSEALYFPLSLVAVSLWIDFLRASRLTSLVGAGLVLGLMIGIRVAGAALYPLHLVAIFIRRPRGWPLWIILFAAVVPPAFGVVGERLLYTAVHGDMHDSQAPNMLTGKAAMLVGPEMKFTGRYAQSLEELARQLDGLYAPLQRIVANAPTIAVQSHISAPYEGAAQYSILAEEMGEAAKREGTSIAVIRSELGRQIMLQNVWGYLKLTMLNDVGQWSIAAQRFPPNARTLAAFADANPNILFGGRIPRELFYPQPSASAYIIYPAFLVAGVITLMLSFGLIVFLVRPSLADSDAGFYLLIASFLSAMCHAYTLFISLVNEWTPRFLMAVFPQLEIIAGCLLLALLSRYRRSISFELPVAARP